MYEPAAGGGYPADASSPGPAPGRSRRLRRGAVITLAGFLAGGAIALTAVTAGGAPAASTVASTAASTAASPASGARGAFSSQGGSSSQGAFSSQGAQLSTALADVAGASAVPAARVRRALGRIRRLGGVEGTATFRGKSGFHTLAFERGTIQSVSGSDVVIKSPDGTTWTWKTVSNTAVRNNGAKAATSALAAGETVFAGGPVLSGTRDARVIIIGPARSPGTSPSPGPEGSQSARTSLS